MAQPARDRVEHPRPADVDGELDELPETAPMPAGTPEPSRSSLRKNRIGAIASITSIGTAATPVG